MDRTSDFELNNGIRIPRIGLGLYRTASGSQTRDAVTWGLEAGYRHFDTAALYGNEQDLGIAIKNSGIAREKIFVTTKLWNDDHGYDAALRAFSESAARLDLSYVDLYLIHWPVQGLRKDSWRALETLHEEGKCRSIGVRNYMVGHLEELMTSARIQPAVNQVEFSPYLTQVNVRKFCKDNNILFESYSPLTKGKRLNDRTLLEIAGRHGKSVPQILIRWTLEQNAAVIPKSVRRDRIFENIDVFDFELSVDDLAILNNLNEDDHTSWDPTNEP